MFENISPKKDLSLNRVFKLYFGQMKPLFRFRKLLRSFKIIVREDISKNFYSLWINVDWRPKWLKFFGEAFVHQWRQYAEVMKVHIHVSTMNCKIPGRAMLGIIAAALIWLGERCHPVKCLLSSVSGGVSLSLEESNTLVTLK